MMEDELLIREIGEPYFDFTAVGPRIDDEGQVRLAEKLLDRGQPRSSIDGKPLRWLTSPAAAIAEVQRSIRIGKGHNVSDCRRCLDQFARVQRRVEAERVSHTAELLDDANRRRNPGKSKDLVAKFEAQARTKVPGPVDYEELRAKAETLQQSIDDALAWALIDCRMIAFESIGTGWLLLSARDSVGRFKAKNIWRYQEGHIFLMTGSLPCGVFDAASFGAAIEPPSPLSLADDDHRLVEEALRLLDSNAFPSITKVAEHLYHKDPDQIAGHGTAESKIKRLSRRISLALKHPERRSAPNKS